MSIEQSNQSRSRPPPDQNQALDADFASWCHRQGIIFGPITAGFVPNGWRGVIAISSIEPNTCILRVPRKILLSCESARNDPALAAALAITHTQSLPSLALLAVHVLHEINNGSDSFWSVYLKTLPPSYSTAMCLKENHINALQVSYAQRQCAHAQDTAKSLYNIALPVLTALNMSNISFEKWTWALSTLSSRTMFLPDDEAGCLTPFGDLHNYEPPPPPYTPQLLLNDENTTETEKLTSIGGDGKLEGDYYCIYARRKYANGEEVFLCYGRHTNIELLEHYGFVLEENPHEGAVLQNSTFPEAIAGFLKDWGAEPLIHNDGNPSWELLRALRLAALTPAERKSNSWLALEDKKVSDASELKAMKILKDACEATLKSLPTTLEEDEALLHTGNVDENMAVVVQWRKCYKRYLTRAMSLCDAVIATIDPTQGSNQPKINVMIRQPKFGRQL